MAQENKETCTICLEEMVSEKLPISLECNHKFCFLCIKGFYQNNPSCPLCRREITDSVINNLRTKLPKTEFSWCYSGRNYGWWAYDPITSEYLESQYGKSKEIKIDLMGREYTIDFINMEQIGPMGKRKIRREKNLTSLAKGIAGLKLD